MSAPDAPPVSAFLPHRGDVLLLDTVLAHSPGATEVRVVAGRSPWLACDDGSVPAWLVLEYMAQAVAAHEGLVARAEGRDPSPGFLVAVNGLRLPPAGFAPGDALRVSARRVSGSPKLGAMAYRCALRAESGGEVVAEGRISVSLRGPRFGPSGAGR